MEKVAKLQELFEKLSFSLSRLHGLHASQVLVQSFYTKPQQRKKEESEWLRVERDQIKFIDLRFLLQVYLILGLNCIITKIILFFSELCWEMP